MSENRPLDPAEQNRVLEAITLLLTHTLPPGWEQADVQYAAVGSHTETRMQVKFLSQQFPSLVEPPAAVDELFAELRAGMYRPGTGTWFTAVFHLDFPFSYGMKYDYEALPRLGTPPPAEALDEERRLFPRDAEHTPEWLAPSEQPAGAAADEGLRLARPFDSVTADGAPVVERPEVPADQRDALVQYLERSPIVLAARSFDEDVLDPSRAPKVPLTFHTDGSWVWPGAVGYYLRAHGVSPEPALVEHIRARGFQIPEVAEEARNEAVAVVTGSSPS
ncbi:hypothetical protein [Actinomadura fibrosa]|uniref:Uncharacterized protein n=1 Tax=Actinomadura fibrosa TaxID=111802 RepID=A0ABW2Y0K2_9ACTN|nr:hypothetical protein [Actinomadura fibrosa]